MRCSSSRILVSVACLMLLALTCCSAREPFSLHVVEFARPTEHSGHSIIGVVSYQRVADAGQGRIDESTSLSMIKSYFSLERQNYDHWVWPDERIAVEFANPDHGVWSPEYTVPAPKRGVLQDDIEAVAFAHVTFMDDAGLAALPRQPNPRPELHPDEKPMPLLVVGRSGVRVVSRAKPEAEVTAIGVGASMQRGGIQISSVGSTLTVRGHGEDTDLWLGGLCHADGVQRHGDCLTIRAHMLLSSKLELGQAVPRRLGMPHSGSAAIDLATWKAGDRISVTGKSAAGWFAYLIYADPPAFLAPHQVDASAVAYVVTLLEDSPQPYRNDWIGAGDERAVRRALEDTCDARLDEWWKLAVE